MAQAVACAHRHRARPTDDGLAALDSLSRVPAAVAELGRVDRRAVEGSPVRVWRASSVWLLPRRLGLLNHGRVVHSHGEGHREVAVLHRSVKKPCEGLATEAQ